jgi:hypothetical protein
VTNTCVACGAASQACCEANTCAGGGCCNHATNSCVPSGGACGGGTCASGSCGTCGGVGQPASGGNVGCTAPNAVDNFAGQCVACGGDAEPCCYRIVGGNFHLYCPEPYACAGIGFNRTCTHCGLSGEPCCDGRFCNGGGACGAGGTCP